MPSKLNIDIPCDQDFVLSLVVNELWPLDNYIRGVEASIQDQLNMLLSLPLGDLRNNLLNKFRNKISILTRNLFESLTQFDRT